MRNMTSATYIATKCSKSVNQFQSGEVIYFQSKKIHLKWNQAISHIKQKFRRKYERFIYRLTNLRLYLSWIYKMLHYLCFKNIWQWEWWGNCPLSMDENFFLNFARNLPWLFGMLTKSHCTSLKSLQTIIPVSLSYPSPFGFIVKELTTSHSFFFSLLLILVAYCIYRIPDSELIIFYIMQN